MESNTDIEILVDLITKKLDLDFNLHESDYLGEYYLYNGLFADRFTIMNNRLPSGEFLINDNTAQKNILKINFIDGKNKDKESKLNFLKQQLLTILSIELVSEEIKEFD